MKHVRAACAGIAVWASALLACAAVPAAVPPRPYTPVVASPDRFDCLGRSSELGPFLLPSQITSAGKPLLARAARLVAEPDVLGGLAGRPVVASHGPDSATWTWAADSSDLHASATMTGDCDGFCWYEIRLEPKHPLALRSLALELPRTAETSKYLLTARYTWSNTARGLAELGRKWSGAFVPYLWLGDEARGLAWTAESAEGWHLSDPRHALDVETRADGVRLRVTFIDHEVTLSKPLALRWGLMASPVKPVSFAWRAAFRVVHDVHYESCDPGPNGRCELDDLRDGGAKAAVIHDSWTAYFGQTAPANEAKLRRLIDACHRRGLKLLVYIGYGLARTAPEMQGHHDQWSVMPLIPWNPSYKPQTRGFDATCAASGWSDWLVDGVDKLFARYQLDGLYLDGTSEAWACRNDEHGCGWTDDQGHRQPKYPVLATRRLMRRIADAVHRHNPDGILDVHMSDNMTLPTLSFCDSAWNGEQFEGYTAAQKFTVPLDAFRTQFMGYAHGLDTEFLCYENRPFTFDEAIALAWVHGVEVRPYPATLKHVTPIWRAMDRFGIVGAAWHPYWVEPLATADDPDTKISGWLGDGSALLVVSHLKRSAADLRVRWDSRYFKTGSAALHVTDALTGRPIATDSDHFGLSFDAMSCRFIEIAP